MNREEAIEWMQEEKASFERAPDLNGCPMTEYWQKAIDVYDMAISALRQQDHFREVTKKMDPMTNADRIRVMSDEELAEFLIDLADDGNLKIREWLQRPSGEEDKHETV